MGLFFHLPTLSLAQRDNERSLGLFAFLMDPDGAGVGVTPLQRTRSEGEEAVLVHGSGRVGGSRAFSFVELKNVKKCLARPKTKHFP